MLDDLWVLGLAAGDPIGGRWCVKTHCKSCLDLCAGAPKSGPMLDDLWVLDVEGDLTWQPLSPAGRSPHARCSHTAVAIGADIVFHGGSYYKCKTLPSPLLCAP